MSANFYFGGNNGFDRRGVDFKYARDTETGLDIPTVTYGGSVMRNGRIPRRVQAISVDLDNQPQYRGQRIVRASIVTEDLGGGKKRYQFADGSGETRHLVKFNTGLDVIEGSTANHMARLVRDRVVIRPHGIVSFDEEALRLLHIESKDLAAAGYFKDPNASVGKTEVHRLGKDNRHGLFLPSIGCSERTSSQWIFGAKGVALWGTIMGPLYEVRRNSDGELNAKELPDSMRPLFEKLLFADLEKLRNEAAKEAAAKAEAERAAKAALVSPEPAPSAPVVINAEPAASEPVVEPAPQKRTKKKRKKN